MQRQSFLSVEEIRDSEGITKLVVIEADLDRNGTKGIWNFT
jgi:hypothetical protein